jgi:hypothetical protein
MWMPTPNFRERAVFRTCTTRPTHLTSLDTVPEIAGGIRSDSSTGVPTLAARWVKKNSPRCGCLRLRDLLGCVLNVERPET